MKLQTTIPLDPTDYPIDYGSAVLLLGSCFSENLGRQFAYYKFQGLQNPFGILFHPQAIAQLIVRAVQKNLYTTEEVFASQGRWLCFDAHSDLSASTSEDLVAHLNTALDRTAAYLSTASHVFITLGTAWVYRSLGTDKVVANCHKVPQREFSKELLSIAQIQSCLEQIIQQIGSLNENAQVIFTVSPVRHLKDGFAENQRSKAHLIAAVHEFLASTDRIGHVSYFPSYEIMLDELRDYRFYEADLIHPNPMAIRYIWEKFTAAYMTSETQITMDKVDRVQKGLGHRPFNPGSEQYLAFRKSLKEKITYLKQRYPHMDFTT